MSTNTHRVKLKGPHKLLEPSEMHNKERASMLTFDNINFTSRAIEGGQESRRHYTQIKDHILLLSAVNR